MLHCVGLGGQWGLVQPVLLQCATEPWSSRAPQHSHSRAWHGRSELACYIQCTPASWIHSICPLHLRSIRKVATERVPPLTVSLP